MGTLKAPNWVPVNRIYTSSAKEIVMTREKVLAELQAITRSLIKMSDICLKQSEAPSDSVAGDSYLCAATNIQNALMDLLAARASLY